MTGRSEHAGPSASDEGPAARTPNRDGAAAQPQDEEQSGTGARHAGDEEPSAVTDNGTSDGLARDESSDEAAGASRSGDEAVEASRSGDEPVEPPRFTARMPTTGSQRLWRALTQRPRTRHVWVAVLVALLGFAGAVHVTGDDEDPLAHARRDELLQIYDGLSRQADRLEEEIIELRRNRDDLVSSADSENVALEQAEERLVQSQILAGTAEAVGPGIQMTISDSDGSVMASHLYAAVQELRSAGAEAIQIEGLGNDTAVRVVTDTYFITTEIGSIDVAGVQMRPPYVLTAIGDPVNLEEAMHFPQGVVSKIENVGAEATVTQFSELTVDVLHEVSEPEYLQPAPEDE